MNIGFINHLMLTKKYAKWEEEIAYFFNRAIRLILRHLVVTAIIVECNSAYRNF